MKKRKLLIFAVATFISATTFAQSNLYECHQVFQACSSEAVSYDNIEKVCYESLKQEKLKCNQLTGQDQNVCLFNFINNEPFLMSDCTYAYTQRPMKLASDCEINYHRCIASSSSR